MTILSTWKRVGDADKAYFDPVFPSSREGRAARVAFRKRHRRCTQCGVPLAKDEFRQTCPVCSQKIAGYAARYKLAHPEYVERHKAAYIAKNKTPEGRKHRNAVRRAYYEANWEKGLCVKCPREALPGLTKCAVHKAASDRDNERRRAA